MVPSRDLKLERPTARVVKNTSTEHEHENDTYTSDIPIRARSIFFFLLLSLSPFLSLFSTHLCSVLFRFPFAPARFSSAAATCYATLRRASRPALVRSLARLLRSASSQFSFSSHSHLSSCLFVVPSFFSAFSRCTSHRTSLSVPFRTVFRSNVASLLLSLPLSRCFLTLDPRFIFIFILFSISISSSYSFFLFLAVPTLGAELAIVLDEYLAHIPPSLHIASHEGQLSLGIQPSPSVRWIKKKVSRRKNDSGGCGENKMIRIQSVHRYSQTGNMAKHTGSNEAHLCSRKKSFRLARSLARTLAVQLSQPNNHSAHLAASSCNALRDALARTRRTRKPKSRKPSSTDLAPASNPAP